MASAIEECESAVSASPRVGRLRFQLGRAYWAAELWSEALREFLEAERLGYVPAWFYLGQLHELGLIEGDDGDVDVARDFYLLAANAGFRPASRAYQELAAAQGEVDFEALDAPVIARLVYDGAFSRLDSINAEPRRAHRFLWAYAEGVHDLLKLDPDRSGLAPACRRLLDPAADAAIQRLRRAEPYSFPADWAWLERELNNSILGGVLAIRLLNEAVVQIRLTGTDDFYQLVEQGGCEGNHARRFYDHLRRFVTAEAGRRAR